jgi:hypothetical protein
MALKYPIGRARHRSPTALGSAYSGSAPGALLLAASMAAAFAPGAAAMATACHFRLLPVLTAHLLPEGSQATTW